MQLETVNTVIYYISTFIFLVLGVLLFSLRKLRNTSNTKYRKACQALGAAVFMVALGHIALLQSGRAENGNLEIFSFPIIFVSSIQAMIFTFVLTMYFSERYVTKQSILMAASPSILYSILYALSLVLSDQHPVYTLTDWADQWDNPPMMIRTLYCFSYLIQVCLYTHYFFMEKKFHQRGQSESRPLSNKEQKGLTYAFLFILSTGLMIITSCFYTHIFYDLLLTILITIFYSIFIIVFIYYGYTNQKHRISR